MAAALDHLGFGGRSRPHIRLLGFEVPMAVSHEVQFVRDGVADGLRLAGTRMYWRRAYTMADLQQGLVERCPFCYDPVLKSVANKRCTCCYGTGFDGGYAEPEYVWASILLNTGQDERHDDGGISYVGDSTIKLPATIWAREGDLFAEVRVVDLESGPVELGRVWQLDGPVRRQTVQGWVSTDDVDELRRSQLEDILVSQDGPVKLLPLSDPRAGADFWGIELEGRNQGVWREHEHGGGDYFEAESILPYGAEE